MILPLAEDFKTIYGKEYKNAQITRVKPDGIVVKTKSGLSKIYFVELPTNVQQHFHYDPQPGAQYTAHTLEKNRVIQQQQAEEARKQAEQKRMELEVQRQQAEVQRQQAEVQRQQAGVQQQQAETLQQHAEQRSQLRPPRIYSRSQEGVPEHLYELTQDYKIDYAGATIRFRRGEQFRGRILR